MGIYWCLMFWSPSRMFKKISALCLFVLIFISFIDKKRTTILTSSSFRRRPTMGSIVKISAAFLRTVKSYLIGYYPWFFRKSFCSFGSPTLTASKSSVWSICMASFKVILNASASSTTFLSSYLTPSPSTSSTSSTIVSRNFF